MKILKTTAIAALLSCSMMTPAPAVAQSAPPPELEAICAATTIVRPDPNSLYRATLNTSTLVSTTGSEYETSRRTISSTPGGVLLGTTPPVFVAGTEGRNGGSPNIFGEFVSTATYSGGSLVQEVVYARDTTYTFGCVVSKTNKNNGNVETPPGLQVAGLTYTSTATTRTETETVTAPNVTTNYFTSGVVCNSPLKNPGAWRSQNGYQGDCSTAKFLSLGAQFVHTNSVPLLPPINAKSDHDESRNGVDSMPAFVTDNDPYVIESN